MPRPSLTRRQFLHGTGAAAALVLLGGRFGRAQEAAGPRFTFALASDTHIGKGSFTRQWEQAVGEINDYHPSFLLFLGDLVDQGEKPENQVHYPTWVEAAKKLQAPWVCVPGNHDPVALFQEHVRKETDSVFDWQDQVRVIAFHDAQPNPGHMGSVTPAQVEWIDRMIASAPGRGKNVLLASHVVFHKNGHPDRGWYVTEGRAAFEAVLRKHASRIFAMFTGHYHNGIRGWDDLGIHEVMMPAVSYNQARHKDPKAWEEQGGGFVLPEFTPGWVQAEVWPDRILLKYKPLGATSEAQKSLPG